MNENARALYEDLKASRLRQFDMASWCGTARCIGGEAYCRAMNIPIAEPDYDDSGQFYKMKSTAAEFLGLTESVSLALFYPPDLEDSENVHLSRVPSDSPWAFMETKNPYSATQQEAAEALKRACELSEVQ